MNLFTKQKQAHKYSEQTVTAWMEEVVGGMDWKFGFSRSKPLCVEWTNNKVLWYSTGSGIQYSEINHYGKGRICVYS